MRSLLLVAYTRNLSGSHVSWSCIFKLILERVCLHVMCVRNLTNSQVPWSCIYMPIMDNVQLCVRNPSSSLIPWRYIYTLILEDDHLIVVFVGNLSSSLVPRVCTYTLNTHFGSLYVLCVGICWWCLVHWNFEALNLNKNLQAWVGMTKCMWNVTSLLGDSKLYISNPYSTVC